MTNLKGKIDFTLFISVRNANPNGDPLNGNRPRVNYSGCGEISDVCIKRKIRNRMQDLGQKIFCLLYTSGQWKIVMGAPPGKSNG